MSGLLVVGAISSCTTATPPEDCLSQPTELSFRACLRRRGPTELKAMSCRQFEETQQRYFCHYEQLRAQDKLPLPLCTKSDAVVDPSCLSSIAVELNDRKYCESLRNRDYKGSCYSFFSITRNKGMEDCFMPEVPEVHRESCVRSAAAKRGYEEGCWVLSNQKERDQCLGWAAAAFRQSRPNAGLKIFNGQSSSGASSSSGATTARPILPTQEGFEYPAPKSEEQLRAYIFNQVWGPNGLTYPANVLVEADPQNPGKFLVQLDPSIEGEVYSWVSYANRHNQIVDSRQILIHSKPVGKNIEKLELVSKTPALPAGAEYAVELWATFDNGRKSIIFPKNAQFEALSPNVSVSVKQAYIIVSAIGKAPVQIRSTYQGVSGTTTFNVQ